MIALDIFAVFFDGSKMLVVLAKWIFVNTIPNHHSVQTLVQGILVYTTLNIWNVCIRSLLYTWNLCCFHLSTPALHCFAGTTRRREQSNWITSQVQLHICTNLFQQCDRVSTCTEHLCYMHEFEHSHIAGMLCRVKSLTPKIQFRVHARSKWVWQSRNYWYWRAPKFFMWPKKGLKSWICENG
jgi:hypothetical protein